MNIHDCYGGQIVQIDKEYGVICKVTPGAPRSILVSTKQRTHPYAPSSLNKVDEEVKVFRERDKDSHLYNEWCVGDFGFFC